VIRQVSLGYQKGRLFFLEGGENGGYLSDAVAAGCCFAPRSENRSVPSTALHVFGQRLGLSPRTAVRVREAQPRATSPTAIAEEGHDGENGLRERPHAHRDPGRGPHEPLRGHHERVGLPGEAVDERDQQREEAVPGDGPVPKHAARDPWEVLAS